MKAVFIFSLFLCVLEVFGQNSSLKVYGEPEPIRSINSQYDENYIAIHPDGKQLIITRRNHPGNIGDKHNPGDLWISTYDTIWSRPGNSVNIHPTKLVTPLGFVNQGDRFLYSTTVFDLGVFRGEVWISEIKEKELVSPQKLEVSDFVNLSEHQSGAISANGKHILFSMEGNFSYGVEDLYVSHLQSNGKWSRPKNLGYRINTAFQEYTPFLAADNETLVFASNGRNDTRGSFDLYVSTRIDDTWQNWSEPENLGDAINTQGSEMSFTFLAGSDYAYYSSTTDSDGYGDIKKIRITADIEVVEEAPIVLQVEESPEDSNSKVFLLVDDDRNAVQGTLLLIGEQETIEVESGGSLELETFEDLVVETRADGYLNHVTNVTAVELDENDSIFVSVEALTVGNTINLEHVLFHQGTANFIAGSEAELDRVAQMLTDNPGVRILLKGHTDNQGDPYLNLELSRARVRTVQDYLMDKGINFRRIEGKGYGGNDPIAPNNTEENRRLNRRVEFTIVENK